MAALFVLLALLPVGAGALVTGDFSQYLYKPSYKQVYFILRNRVYLIGASAGPSKGAQLAPHAHFSRAMWFSWANFNPGTALAA